MMYIFLFKIIALQVLNKNFMHSKIEVEPNNILLRGLFIKEIDVGDGS